MKQKLALPLLLMLVFAVTRWPGLMPENFSAAYAMAFCAGVYFRTSIAWWLPLATLLVTDIVINVAYYGVAPLNSWMVVNCAGFAAIIWLGRRFKPGHSWISLLGGGLLGALFFYLLTNTMAWLQLGYARTLAGWIQALTVGLPGFPPTWEFFRNTLLSGGLFTGLFVGAMKWSAAMEETEEEETVAGDEPSEPEEAKA